MKKQYLFAGLGLICVILLFIFGRTSQPLKSSITAESGKPASLFDIRQFIKQSKQKLTSTQSIYVAKLENNIRSVSASEQAIAYNSLANFWKDSLQLPEPYAFYISESAKLDKSEKKLTFAARLFLTYLRNEQDEAKLNWETTEAITLFERAIQINPDNDDLRLGLGSCYIYGKGRTGNPAETMKGIQELLAVARKDSNNMKAQTLLGVGGMVSGQYDKALERFKKVVAREPGNVEAIAYLADVYAAKGEKAEAIKWYTVSKRLVNDPHYTNEVDQRIRMIK